MARFGLAATGWLVVLFGLTRLHWVQSAVLLPWASLQERVAATLTGAPTGTVVVNASCTGGDAMALCVGAILAFPAAWGSRIRGAVSGVLLVSVLNMMRIGSLAFVAGEAATFNLLHLYVWPAVLILVVAAYVYAWMVRVQPRPGVAGKPEPLASTLFGGGFLPLATVMTAAYFLVSSRLFDSPALAGVTAWTARTGGNLLGFFGVSSQATANLLLTEHGNFVVTPECVVTPLIPIYLAAVMSTGTRRWKVLGTLLAAPLFLILGVARLLVLAVPPALLGSPALAIHGFNQVVAGIAVLAAVVVACSEPMGGPARMGPTALRASKLAAFGLLVGMLWSPALVDTAAWLQATAGHAGHVPPDQQGALAMLPAFQLALVAGLIAALAPVSPRFIVWAAGLVALALSQLLLRIAIGEGASHLGLNLHDSLVRGWALAGPMLVAGVMVLARRGATTSAPEPTPQAG